MLGAMQDPIFDLSSKTALVTGASGGLGYRFAEVLANAGAHIIITSRNIEHSSLASLQQRYPQRCLPLPLDVSDRESIDDLFTTIEGHGLTADVLVNNAGIAAGDLARDAVSYTHLTLPTIYSV